MDRSRFDSLLHARRSLLGGGLVAVASWLALPETDAKKRKKKKKCPACPSGSLKLSNGTCAATCETVGENFVGGCQCSNVNLEGVSLRVPHVDLCELLDVICASSADCPKGQHCQPVGCPGENPNRCHAVCAPI